MDFFPTETNHVSAIRTRTIELFECGGHSARGGLLMEATIIGRLCVSGANRRVDNRVPRVNFHRCS